MSAERVIPKTGPLAPARCSSCGAAILWTTTLDGRRMPVDLRPSSQGTVAIEQEEANDGPFWESQVIRAGEREGRVLRTSHFATCPDAARHRRKR